MGGVTITAYGTARRDDEGILDFPTRPNEAASLEQGDVVGFCYEVSGTGESIAVDLSVVAAPEGETPPAPEYFRSMVAPNKAYFRSAPLPDAVFAAGLPLRAYFHATADGGGEVASASCLVFPGSLGRVLSEQRFAPASDAAIAEFEARFDTRLRDDYRAYLKSRNGTNMVWWQDPRWHTGPFQTDDQGLYKPSPFYEELGQLEPEVRERLGAHGEGAQYVFGIGHRHPYIDIAQGDAFGFYRKELMRHAYLVAVDGGGNNYVQVTQGKHAGAIFGCDHELYYGGLSPMVDFDGMDETEKAELPWSDFKDATTDAFIDKASEYGFIYKIDESFEAYYQREVAVARALTDALAPAYLSR